VSRKQRRPSAPQAHCGRSRQEGATMRRIEKNHPPEQPQNRSGKNVTAGIEMLPLPTQPVRGQPFAAPGSPCWGLSRTIVAGQGEV
jgi:hypothetical protein